MRNKGLLRSIISMSLTLVLLVSLTVSTNAATGETTKDSKNNEIKLSKPVLKIKKHYEKNVKLTWDKVDGADSYEVQRTIVDGDYTVIKKTKKLSFIDKKAKKRKKYKYRVVAMKRVNDITYTSLASKAKSVYVLPKNPKVVICGECFVEGMKLYANKFRPKNSSFVYKIGLSTYGLLNTNCKKYRGQTVTCLERVAYYKPDRVYFLIGMNEAKNGSPSTTVKNYKKAFKLLKKINPHVEMVLMALPPVGRSHGSGFASNGSINKYNKAYKKYASKTKNVFYYNDYRPLITDGSGYLKGSADGGDGGHWSSSATIKVVKALKKHSKKLTKR